MSRMPVLAVVLGLCAAGCGSSSTSTTPTSTGPSNTPVFTATMLPANETPAPIAGPESNGSGTVTITFHLTRDSTNTITAASVDFVASMSGFPAGTVLIAAHIHTGATGVGGPVLISTQIAQGEVTMPNGSGTLDHSVTIDSSLLASVQAIINNPAGYYFNIHTPANPGGVARGQLVAKM
jgi:hypothetical protein